MDPQNSDWSRRSVASRCRTVARAAQFIAESADALIDHCASDQRTDPVETVTAELLPLCAALRHIRRAGPRILADRRCGAFSRPMWLWGARAVVKRAPLGRVLILGTWNYPLLLPGVQLAQALAAGNHVTLKPAAGTETATAEMLECFFAAGVPGEQVELLDSSVDAAETAIKSGVDLIVLTGSASTGRKVLEAAAPTLSQSIMELSGCDAVIVMDDADPQRVEDAVAFGLKFNGGATCIGPRRLIVTEKGAATFVPRVVSRLQHASPVIVHEAARGGVCDAIERALKSGAVDCLNHFDAQVVRRTGELRPILLDDVRPDFEIASADLFAPVLSVIKVGVIEEAIEIVNQSPYRLAASIFGSRQAACALAERLDVGNVTINDLIAPTADPRLPFGGRGQSGFGVTRGDEGLLSMTTPKVISTRRGKWLPHLDARQDGDRAMLQGLLQFQYAGVMARRWAGLRRMIHGVKQRGKPRKG